MIKDKIESLITSTLKKTQKSKDLPIFDIPEINMEHPENNEFGDYSSNIAMRLTKAAKKSPLEVAKIIKDNIKEGKYIEKVEIVKPGFVNFYLSKEYFQNQIKEIIEQKDNFGNSDMGEGKKIHLDFVSANPTGPVHLGNGRGGPYGDVLANVLERAGYKVWREYYVNDYGNQIKVLGHSVLKDSEAQYKGDYIDKLHKKIKEKDPFEVGQWAAHEIVENIIKPSMEKLGIKFDQYFFEKKLHNDGKVEKIFKELRDKNLIYEKEGALWFKATEFGDEKDRVIKKSTGEVTYFGGDMAYHKDKFERGNDLAIDIWGADHHGDVARVMGAVKAMGYNKRLKIILTQFVRVLKDGKEYKMSKRAGTYVTIDDLLDEVGKDAVRFFFLMHSYNTHMDFNLDLAKEKSNKNPVFYVQYAHARICSIFRKAGINELSLGKEKVNLSLLKEEAEIDLMRELFMLPEIIVNITSNYEVHRLTTYAVSLADKFHNFYEKCKVLDEDKELQRARLTLLLASKIVLKNTLNILGVGAPERM
jgi:arginyl-tRNA synthetase